MRVGQNYFPKSSFLSVEKDLSRICNKLLENQRLCKLLYYTDRDCLKKEDLSSLQKINMVNKQLKIIPRLLIEEECPNYVVITMDNFSPNPLNPEFRDCTISFDIFCHPNHWNLGDFQLRPYKIAGEIDSLLNGTKLTGIGEINFLSGNNLVLDDNLMGLTLNYSAIHGIEDKI